MSLTMRQREELNSIILGWDFSDKWVNDVLEFIHKYFEPQDIFPENELRNWAENNGYGRHPL